MPGNPSAKRALALLWREASLAREARQQRARLFDGVAGHADLALQVDEHVAERLRSADGPKLFGLLGEYLNACPLLPEAPVSCSIATTSGCTSCVDWPVIAAYSAASFAAAAAPS
jgi:hypothetical protein